ncbi:tpr domain-containing protein [Plasmopara halstedii]|uniref:Tpr domain-containing protein n=1 Tax=Plasmopara halstedii TaxID=4781 RepID=A0A0P1AC25_PLAHL|nr:tpr domain-containing protein [Plasmopara halstedii]CEG38434.1 tpr domain-containing protein [Plasmopara halstedii]|eukprot:XP_024574803.1 tpr domain-containing protein [Plasmopara halstedii]
MACGLTPDLARMLEQIAVEKERHVVKAEQTVIETEANVARIKSKVAKVKDKHEQDEGYDWTRTYEKWDAWEDPEEMMKYEQEARDRSERAKKIQTGCNHDHSAEQKLMDMTTNEKVIACDEFRVLGNLFYQHDTKEEEVQADALKLKLLLNFTACRLKTMHLDDAVHHANQALEIDPKNVKTFYRRAQAYRLKDEFDLAQKDLECALKLTKDGELSQSIESLLLQEKKLLHAKMLAYKLRTKQLSAAMFGVNDKIKGCEQVYRDDARYFGAHAMALNLSNITTRSKVPSNDFPCLDTSQPSIRGLTELQSLVNEFKKGPNSSEE